MACNTRHSIVTPVRIALCGALVLLSTRGLASGPVPFNQWSVANGTIDASATCNSAGVTCTQLSQDDGFLQQQVTTANGTFIQMILTEPGATGTAASLGFVTENFIPTANVTGWDIQNQQIIRDPAQGFEQVAKIERVPFYDASDTLVDLLHVDLQQTLISDEFDSNFKLLKDAAKLGTGELYSGNSMDINQNIVAASSHGPAGIKMTFDSRQRSGWQLGNVNNTLQFDPFAPAAELALESSASGSPVPGTIVSWNDGDTVTSTWLSQYNDEIAQTGFAFQGVENQTSGTRVTRHSIEAVAVIDPFNWNDLTFGQPPSLP